MMNFWWCTFLKSWSRFASIGRQCEQWWRLLSVARHFARSGFLWPSSRIGAGENWPRMEQSFQNCTTHHPLFATYSRSLDHNSKGDEKWQWARSPGADEWNGQTWDRPLFVYAYAILSRRAKDWVKNVDRPSKKSKPWKLRGKGGNRQSRPSRK